MNIKQGVIGGLAIIVASHLFASNHTKDFQLFKQTNIYKSGKGGFEPIDSKSFANTKIKQILVKVKNRNQMFNVFVAPNGNFIIGRAFTKKGKPLLFKAQLPKPINMKKQENKEAYVIGSGKKDYYVFTDPICPFCAGLEAFMPKLEKIGRFHIFFYPLDELHPTSRHASAYIMSQNEKNRAQLVKKIMIDKNQNYKKYKVDKKYYAMVRAQRKIGDMLKVRGTPSIYNSKGAPVDTILLLQKAGVSNQQFINKVRVLANKERRIEEQKYTNKPIPPVVQNKVDVRALKLLDEKDATIIMGQGKKVLYVFMSTQCPHCREMFNNNKINKILKKYTIHFVIFPLPGYVMSKYETAYLYLLHGKARVHAFQEIMKGKKVLSAKDEKHLEDALSTKKGEGIVEKMGTINIILKEQHIDTVPTIVTSTGKILNSFSL